jgi:pSer/pThr/pTyr-binding forkhead associated (FHA) protein
MKETGRGRAIPVDGGSFTLGRDSACSCILADQTVSRRHAVIVQHGREFTVHDLNSTSGTYVNNVRILSSNSSSIAGRSLPSRARFDPSRSQCNCPS